MGRRAKIWKRGDRGYYATVNGKQTFLAHDFEEAERRFYRMKAGEVEEDMPVRTLLDLFLADCEGRVKPKTHRVYAYFFRDFPKKSVSELRPFHVDAWMRKDWGQSTRRAAVGAIRAALNWGVKKGRISPNPYMASLERPATVRRKPMPTGELEKILTKANPRLKALLTSLRETGARPDELMRARIEDLKDGVIVLAEHKTDKKTDKPRMIYLNARTRETVEKEVGNRTSGHIFRNTRGNPWNQCSVWAAMRRLGVKGCVYQLRHSFASSAINSGMDSLWVAKLLGHSSPATVYKHYFEEDPEAMKRAVEEATKTKAS